MMHETLFWVVLLCVSRFSSCLFHPFLCSWTTGLLPWVGLECPVAHAYAQLARAGRGMLTAPALASGVLYAYAAQAWLHRDAPRIKLEYHAR